MKKLLTILVTVLLAGVVLVVAGCQKKEKYLAEKVSVQLKWIHQAQFAGFYIAEKNGFYKEENIEVVLNPCGPDESPDSIIEDVVSGQTTFAVIGAEMVLKARAAGKPIIAISVIFQRSPYVYIALKESKINRPRDFEGKKISIPDDSAILHQMFLKKLQIQPSVLEVVPYERDTKPLATGLIDISLSYRTGLVLDFEAKGYVLNMIWPNDYGIHFYADTIITSNAMVQQHPELVERFLRATLRGWRHSIENQQEAIDVTLQYDPTLDKSIQQRMVKAQTPLIHTGEIPIGWMDESVWQTMYQMLLDVHVVTQPIKMEEAYTMQFLNKIYDQGQ